MTGEGPLSSKEIDRMVEAAAKAADYEQGFGVKGCDLGSSRWCAAYIRQSREEQAKNNRIPEYLLNTVTLSCVVLALAAAPVDFKAAL